MKARNDKTLEAWLNLIKMGLLFPPRFQRPIVWKKSMVIDLLTGIFHKEPMGVFWVLETDSAKPLFAPRNIDGESFETTSCQNLLLDGQQRITALWKAFHNKAFHDKDMELSFYAKFDDTTFQISEFVGFNRKTSTNRALADDPKKQLKRKLLPVHLLNPRGKAEAPLNNWLTDAEVGGPMKNDIAIMVENAKKVFENCVIPYFSLPQNTTREKALNVFQKINTNSVTLTKFHLAASEMERKENKCLYSMTDKLEEATQIEALETSDETGELMLKIFCLLQGKKPTRGIFLKLPFDELAKEETQKKIIDGLKWTKRMLAELKIWTGEQLPSVVPLRVLPALHQFMPQSKKELAEANRLIRKYLWHSFLTNRYKEKANERLKTDFDALKSCLTKNEYQNDIEVFNSAEHPAPDKEKIKEAAWPRGNNALPRGILLVCCQGGAKTLESEEELDDQNYHKRQKHHIFPKSKLAAADCLGNLALNCMLIPGEDNQNYDNKFPGDYIGGIISQLNGDVSEEMVEELLKTHLLPSKIAKKLLEASEKNMTSESELKNIFDEFMNMRAEAVEEKIKKLLDQ